MILFDRARLSKSTAILKERIDSVNREEGEFTIVHSGPHDEIDRAYGTLAAHVAEHELAVEGPLREYYLVGPGDTSDAEAWRTEIGWPVFATGTSG